MSEILRVTWRITPLHPPRPRRNCGSCNATTSFISSGRFRTNAQKKRMDVWLIYRCAICDGTWNMPILERSPIAGIAPEQLHAFMHNDPAVAARHAFDLALLARHSDRIDQDAAATIEKQEQVGDLAQAAGAEIVLVLGLPCRLRLDGLLARELGVTRSALLTAYEAGVIALASPKALRAPAFDGQRIRVDLARAPQCGIYPARLWKQAT